MYHSFEYKLQEWVLPAQPGDCAADLVVLHDGHELVAVGQRLAGDHVSVHVHPAELEEERFKSRTVKCRLNSMEIKAKQTKLTYLNLMLNLPCKAEEI